MSSQSLTQDGTDKLFQGIMDAHTSAISKAIRMSKTPLDPGAYFDEWEQSQTSPISIMVGTDRPVLAKTIMWSFLPTNLNGNITIGPGQGGAIVPSGKYRTFYIPSNGLLLPGFMNVDGMILNKGDVIILTISGSPTFLYVEVTGQILSGSDWSRT